MSLIRPPAELGAFKFIKDKRGNYQVECRGGDRCRWRRPAGGRWMSRKADLVSTKRSAERHLAQWHEPA